MASDDTTATCGVGEGDCACQAGTELTADRSDCIPCGAGAAGTGGTCSQCAAGTEPNSDQTTCVSYSWETTEFDDCPIDCSIDESTLTRVVTCMSSEGSGDDAALCTDAKPDETSICDATAACVTFHWSVAPFSNCATECGANEEVQTRDVTCKDTEGNVATDEGFCD